jgi:hypothetical protein
MITPDGAYPLSDVQYNRVAKRLDGKNIELAAAERSVAKAFCRDEHALAGLLDVELPEGLRQDYTRIVRRARAKTIFRHVRFGFYSGCIAAALLFLAMGLTRLTTAGMEAAGRGESFTEAVSRNIFKEEFWLPPAEDKIPDTPTGPDFEMLGPPYTPVTEAGQPVPVDVEIEALRQRVNQLENGADFGETASGI